MAKITAPLLSFGASGAIAKTQVYATWKGRPYVRRHVIPSNPKTTAQTLTRDVFKNASSIWKLMGNTAVAPWNRFATGQVLTGRNAMMASFVRELRGETDLLKMVFSPGSKGGLAALSMVLTPGADQITVDLTAPALPTGWTIFGARAVAIFDQDPSTMTIFETSEGIDVSTPYSIILTGLTDVGPYQVGGWFTWTKPDGTFAEGTSLLGQATPT